MIQGVKVCPACSREYGNEHQACPADGVALIAIDTDAGDRGENLLGQVVGGRYRLERVVGRGGMGTVYACRHVVVGKTFAMKVLRPGIERSEEILQRFIREAQAANSIGSRHICEVTDFGQLDNGAFYVVMELIEGVSMTRALRDGRLTHADIQHVFIQIADTLQMAHERGIIHRDLKPDNVLLLKDEGDPHFAKLLDFGIAKMIQAEASNLTETGVILGTPYYMSPEQARGDPVDHRSDIYALGVMMYRAFTGRLPFMADTAMGVLTRHLTEVPEAPSSIGNVDSHTERVILRCMEKKPIDRFQAMADVSEALRSCAGRPTESKNRPTVDETSGRELRKALDERLAAEGLAPEGTGSPSAPTWGPNGPPSDVRQTTPRFTAVAVATGHSQPGFPAAPGAPGAAAAQAPRTATPGAAPLVAPTGSAATPTAGAPSAAGVVASPPQAAVGPPGAASPWPPLQSGPMAPVATQDGAALDHQVEAFTARGLVSPTLDTESRGKGSSRFLLWAGAVTAMMVLGGASAFVLLSPTGASSSAPGDGSPTVTDSPADPDDESTSAAADDEGAPVEEPAAALDGGDGDTPSEDAGAATAVPSSPASPSPPPGTRRPGITAPPKPTPQPTTTQTNRPEIRSPFE
jgi:serine/threonine-protein kinase